MTGHRRKPTRRLPALSASASVLTLLVAAGGIRAITPTPALAACDATNPNSGDTVTCDTSPPNPETAGIVIADGSSNTRVVVLPGAILETTGGPALSVGVGDYNQLIDNQGIIRTVGNNAPAILIAPGGVNDGGAVGPTNTGTLILVDNTFGLVETSGDDSPGIVYGEVGSGPSASTDGSLIMFDSPKSTIATTGDRSPGYVFGGIGAGPGDAFIGVAGHQLSVTTQGDDSAGVIFNALGDTGTQEFVFIDAGFTVGTVGDRSPGVVFGQTQTNTPSHARISSFQASDISVNASTQGDDSVGFFFGPGAVPSGEAFVASFVSIGGTVVTSGNNSHGIVYTEGLSNAQPGQSVKITATNLVGDVTTSGDNSHGIILGDGLGTTRTDMDYTSNMAIGGGLSATTSGANSHALVLSENTTLSLLGQGHSGAVTANGTIVSGTIDSFDTFVATGTNSRAVMNHGILYGTFTVDDAVVGNLGNNGLIESADGAAGVAVQFTGTTDDIFELQTKGVVIGSVEAGLGTDTFVLGGVGSASFDTALIGTQYVDFEQFEKTGSSTWTLTGGNALGGPFGLTEGTLVQNAILDNVMMTVGPNGRLEGVGTVGGLVIDGTVAPGKSIGTIKVAGDVVFNPGSTYEVEVRAPDRADLISVAGTATINGGAVEIVKLSGETSYQGGQSYRIIEAGTLVRNGDFTLNQPFLFLSSDLRYGANHVDIVLTGGAPGQDFTSVARTYNQFEAATGLNDLEQSGDALEVYNQLLFLTDADEARRAFDLSSGEMHASGQHVVDQTFSLFSRTLRGQASAGLGLGGNGGRVYTAPLGFAPARGSAGAAAIDDATTPAGERVANAWIAPLGGGGTIDADGNAGQLDWWTAGLAGGYEGPVDVAAGHAWAGFGLGYMRSHGAVDARLSTFDADNFQVGLYGGWADGPWSLAGSLAYGASGIDTERRIVFGDIDRTAKAEYWSHTIGFSGEAAYGFDVATGTTLSPLVTLDAGWAGHGGFTETGAGALNLTGASEDWTRFDTGLGLAVAHTFVTESGAVTLDGRAVWEHAFADVVPSQALVFAGSPTGFEVLGPDAGRDRLRLGAGLSFQATEDMTIRAGYAGLFSGDQQNHTATLGLKVKL